MSFEITERVAPVTLARVTGGSYLAFMVASVLADRVAHIGLGSAAQVYGSIVASPMSFRLGLATAFISTFLFLMAAWGLYVLLRPVNHDLALLFLLLNAVGVAIQCASMLQLLSAMQPGQGEANALIAIDAYRAGFAAVQLFFGTWLFPLGYLVLRSGFLPRLLGVLLIADGVFEQVWFLQSLLLPDYPSIKAPGTVVSLLAEVGLALWLLIRGVRHPRAGAATLDTVAAGRTRTP